MPRRGNAPDDPFNRQDVDNLVNSAISGFFRLNPQQQMIVGIVALLVCFGIAIYIYRHQSHATPALDANALLGNPSNAGSDRDDYLMVKPYFTLSYNNSRGEPNWVSWRVAESDLGSAPRKQTFDPDDTLPTDFNIVRTGQYSGSGFDRGHMCPHSDRAASEEMSYATFVMTNIIPQAPNVNRKAWAQLEVYSRHLVKKHNRLYVMSGPIGLGGTGSKGYRELIGGGRVTVPAECWKVIVVVPENGAADTVSSINASDRVIAVDMPNDETQVGEIWDKYRCRPINIEQKTGLHFFTSLPPALAAQLDQKLDDEFVPEPRPLTHERD